MVLFLSGADSDRKNSQRVVTISTAPGSLPDFPLRVLAFCNKVASDILPEDNNDDGGGGH
jgi:hypothetical protein